MPKPQFCPNPHCPHHHRPPRHWRVDFGCYPTVAHGWVRRYRCRACGKTLSDQTESLHYYAKRRLPLKAIVASLLGGASQREVARRYHVSPMAIHHAVLRLGRQAMAAQLLLLDAVPPRSAVVFDGLRSCVSSHDYPCDITTVVDTAGEMVLSMTHAIMRRGGRMTSAHRRRIPAKYQVWQPAKKSYTDSISLLSHEIADYLRPPDRGPAVIDTDEHPLYQAVLSRSPVYRHLRRARQFRHIRTASTAPRTIENRLFPVNYLDRLLRHRLKEHTRETIALGRHAVMQMHRAWIFAWDHNTRREHRVKRPEEGVHAAWAGIGEKLLAGLRQRFFTRRLRPRVATVPETIRRVWLGLLDTPPLRWKVGQTGTSVRIPAFARRDFASLYQQAG